MNTAARWIITIAIGGTVAAAHVDAVLEWNKVAFEAVAAAKQAPPPTTRSMAIVLPIFANWARARPFVMARPEQFRPGAPPALASAKWAADYNEIKSMGGKTSAARTKEQTAIGQFWIVTGAPAYNSIVRELARRGGRTLSQNARLFALMYLVL